MSELRKSSIEIVPATVEDAEMICDIRDRAWLQTYPNDELGITTDNIRINAQGLNGEFVPRRVAHLRKVFAQMAEPEVTTSVAKLDGTVVGYVSPGIDDLGHRRIDAIYVAPEVQGMGVGGKLIRHAIAVFGRDQDISLDVISYNQNAIAFYEHLGFEKTDAVVLEEEGRPDYMITLPQTEMVLRAIS